LRQLVGNSRSSLRRFGKAGLRQVASLFLAQNCPVCDRPTAQTFCLDCQRQIYPAKSSSTLNALSTPDALSTPSLPKSAHPLPVWALGLYSGSLKQAILALKYGDRPDVAGPLGAALAQHWLAQLPAARSASTRSSLLCAIPIPLHAERQKSRGFNQAELIARAFCQVSEVPLLTHGLMRVQSTRPQHELGLTERQQNLEGVFQVGPSLTERSHRFTSHSKAPPAVLLVDDIYTTGTTAQSAAATLRQAGISVVGIVAIAQAAL
jgi:ComF family protein